MCQVDDKVEDALRSAVRRSLSRLTKLLIGDRKSEPQPLFAVRLSLERSGRIELRPDVQVQPCTGTCRAAAFAHGVLCDS